MTLEDLEKLPEFQAWVEAIRRCADIRIVLPGNKQWAAELKKKLDDN